jgi:regulatory protein
MSDSADAAAHQITAIRLEKTRLMPRAVLELADRPAVYVLQRDAARLKEGDRLAEDRLQDLQQRYHRRAAYLQAVRFLGPRDRSAKEVAEHLDGKGWDGAACADALTKLRDEGYVNDLRFAQNWVAQRCRTAPRSRLAVSQELNRKGIERRTILKAVAAMDEEALALACARKKRRQWQRFNGDERRRRITAFLQRKGFPYEACRKAAASLVDLVGDD